MVLQILFWILLILSAIGVIAPPSPPYARVSGVVTIILFAILGLKVFGPIH